MNNLVIIYAILLLVLFFLKISVYITVLSTSVVCFIGTPGIDLSMFAQKTISSAERLSLLVIPFSVCAGIFMNCTGVTKRIMNYCEVLAARVPGGLAQVNTLLSTLMGSSSGSSLVDAAMQRKMLVPTMEPRGYSESFSTVITAASGIVIPLIPSEVGLTIYGCVNSISVGKLLIAGIGPEIVLCVTLMIFTHFLSEKRGYLPGRTIEIPVSEKIAAVRPAFLPLLLPIITIGGVRIGVFTVSKAGTVTIIYTVLLGLLYKGLTLKNAMQGYRETVATMASIIFIIAVTTCFSWILTKERIPQQSSQWMASNIHNKYAFLIMVNIFLLIVGTFTERNAFMIMLTPLLYLATMAYGTDDIHSIMIYIFNCTIGTFAPPMGTLMFVSCSITKCPTKDFIKGAVPSYTLLAIDITVLTYIPQLTTFPVNVFY